MKRKECGFAFRYNPYCGPIFGNDGRSFDMCISDNCNEENSCLIMNDGTRGYEYHSVYKKSFFTNTAGPDEENKFTVLDIHVIMIQLKISSTNCVR